MFCTCIPTELELSLRYKMGGTFLFLNHFGSVLVSLICLSVGISGHTTTEGEQEDQKSREKCKGAKRGGTAKQGNAPYLIPSVPLKACLLCTHLPALL